MLPGPAMWVKAYPHFVHAYLDMVAAIYQDGTMKVLEDRVL